MAKKWNFATPRVEGIAPKQAAVGIPEDQWDRALGRDGFSGPSVNFYHRNPPTAWTKVDENLRHRMLDPGSATVATDSPWNAVTLLYNADVKFRFWRTNKAMDHLVRNADGDELLFVHRGGGEVYCDFGHIALSEGDYFVIPRGCSWRVEPSSEMEVLLIESTTGSYSLPDSTLTLGRHVPFDPGVFGVPSIDDAFKAQPRTNPWSVHVKRGGKIGMVTFPFNPLDVVAWQGDLYPIRLNINDIRPIMSHRIYLPPSAYATFVSEKFVVCTFMPKPGETDPEAAKLPAFHDNVDYDEVLFLHRGSRAPQRTTLFKDGMLTYHPYGLTHGPHPNAFPLRGRKEPVPLEATFIMLDARNPLQFNPDAKSCDVPGYAESWLPAVNFAPDAKQEKA